MLQIHAAGVVYVRVDFPNIVRSHYIRCHEAYEPNEKILIATDRWGMRSAWECKKNVRY